MLKEGRGPSAHESTIATIPGSPATSEGSCAAPAARSINKRVVAALAGGVGLAAVIAVAILGAVRDPADVAAAAVPLRRATATVAPPPARVLDVSQRRLASEETTEPSVLTIPTITIYGEFPRRGVAEFQRPDKRADQQSIVALP